MKTTPILEPKVFGNQRATSATRKPIMKRVASAKSGLKFGQANMGMENYSDYSKKLYKSIDQWNSKRAKSAKPVSIHGLKYKFKIMDLNKY